MRPSLAFGCGLLGMFRAPRVAAATMLMFASGAAIADVGAPSTVVFASAGGSVFRSTDAGLTWSRGGVIGSGTRAAAVRTLDATAGAVYAGTNGEGVWRSRDDGIIWSSFSGDQTLDFFDYLDFVVEFDAGCH